MQSRGCAIAFLEAAKEADVDVALEGVSVLVASLSRAWSDAHALPPDYTLNAVLDNVTTRAIEITAGMQQARQGDERF